MRDVFIIGVGQTPVGRGGAERGRYLARVAITAAIESAGIAPSDVGALYVGNMMSGMLAQQQQLGALFADVAGLRGIEAFTAEAACASGAAAARLGYLAVAGGMQETALVCGMERMTHAAREVTTQALATAADWELEYCVGESFISLNARLMSEYMRAHKVEADAFAPFAIAAHRNALTNPNALLHKPLDVDGYLASKMLVPPVRLMDAPPTCDGAAAVVLCSEPVAREARRRGPIVRIRASAVATDSLALTGRR